MSCYSCVHMRREWCKRKGHPNGKCPLYERDYSVIAMRKWGEIHGRDSDVPVIVRHAQVR